MYHREIETNAAYAAKHNANLKKDAAQRLARNAAYKKAKKTSK